MFRFHLWTNYTFTNKNSNISFHVPLPKYIFNVSIHLCTTWMSSVGGGVGFFQNFLLQAQSGQFLERSFYGIQSFRNWEFIRIESFSSDETKYRTMSIKDFSSLGTLSLPLIGTLSLPLNFNALSPQNQSFHLIQEIDHYLVPQ